MTSIPTRCRAATLLTVLAAVTLAGCWASAFHDVVDPACLDPAWMAEAATAVGVETDTFAAVLSHLLQEVPLLDGDWEGDFGDARFYAPAVLLGLGHEIGNECLLAFGRAGLDGNRRLIRETQGRPLAFWTQIPDHLMAASGLIDAHKYEGQPADVELIDAVLDRLNGALAFYDSYPAVLGDSLLAMYGPTTQTAAVAVLNLRYALEIGGDLGPDRTASALEIMSAIDAQVYDREREVYLFSPSIRPLRLYPNTMMMLAHCLAYQATGDVRHLQRAEELFERIQPLKQASRGNYRSPYSAAANGAQTEDYSTLSSQLYLIIALCQLYECTGSERYELEARAVLAFICTCLRDGGRLVHHWIDGRAAGTGDPVYYCTGCNFQALYAMWSLDRLEAR